MGGAPWGGLSWIHWVSAEAVCAKTGAGPVHNETSRTLVRKGEEKCVLKMLQQNILPSFHGLFLNMSWCFLFAL